MFKAFRERHPEAMLGGVIAIVGLSVIFGPILYKERREKAAIAQATAAPAGKVSGTMVVTESKLGDDGLNEVTGVFIGGAAPYRVTIRGALAASVLAETGGGIYRDKHRLDATAAVADGGLVTGIIISDKR